MFRSDNTITTFSLFPSISISIVMLHFPRSYQGWLLLARLQLFVNILCVACLWAIGLVMLAGWMCIL